MLTFIIICVVAGAVLGILLAPFVLALNASKMKEVNKLISEFEAQTFATDEEREEAKTSLKKKLIQLKSEISDSSMKEQVSDKMSIL